MPIIITNALSFDLTILLLGIFPTNTPANTGNNAYTRLFTCSIICNSQSLEKTQVSTENKEAMTHPRNKL